MDRKVRSQDRAMTVSPCDVYSRAVDLVAEHVGLPSDAIRSPRGWPAKRARATALYLTVVGAGFSSRSVARVSGVGRSTISGHLRQIEDRRDAAVLDQTLSHLEEQLACAI